MSVFVEANPPEILRAAQKDESFINYIRGQVAEIIQRVFGIQTWMKLELMSDISCILLYYSLTTLLENQTLGEEYVGLVQVDSSLRKLPSKLTRLTAIILQVLGPRVFNQVIQKFDKWIRNSQNCPELKPKAREYLLLITDVVKNSSFWIGRFNLVLFYILGKYYRLSQRITNIHYIFTSDTSKSGTYNSTFRLIGQIGLAHLVLLFVSNIVNKLKNSKIFSQQPNSLSLENPNDAKEVSDSVTKCSLCWDQRKNTACTPCGHLFCWSCILQWLQTKHECPLCRENVEPSRIVPLLNYE